jgi:glycosyltransferase involved in cell wall biosynthesis
MTRQRICQHVVKNAEPESAAVCRIVANISLGLRPFGWRTSVILLGTAGPLRADLEDAGATVESVCWSGTRRTIFAAGGFWRCVRAECPDILHVHEGGLTVRRLGRLAGARHVVQHVHSRILENSGLSVSHVRFRGADAVIATSAAVAACIKDTSPDVICPGVDVAPSLLHARTDTPIVLGVASRLVALKGVNFLIDAIGKVNACGHDVRLEIAGTGPLEPELRAQVSERGLAERITFLGWQHNIQRVMRSWHVVMAPSLEEGFGLSVLEGMAVGLPAIASSVGGLGDLVVDKLTGILVQPGNTEAIATAITELVCDPALRFRMGCAASEYARSIFPSTGMAVQVCSVYNRLLMGRLSRAVA